MSSGQGLKDREGEGARRKITSFSTGPESVPTHWKQTLFLLKEPITVHEGACLGVCPLMLVADVCGCVARYGGPGDVQVPQVGGQLERAGRGDPLHG